MHALKHRKGLGAFKKVPKRICRWRAPNRPLSTVAAPEIVRHWVESAQTKMMYIALKHNHKAKSDYNLPSSEILRVHSPRYLLHKQQQR